MTASRSLDEVLLRWHEALGTSKREFPDFLALYNELNEKIQDFDFKDGSDKLYDGIVSFLLLDRLMLHFFELKGVKPDRLARFHHSLANLLPHRFERRELGGLLATELINLLRTEEDIRRPDVLDVDGAAYLTVPPSHVLVTSGGLRRYFPTVNESISNPSLSRRLFATIESHAKLVLQDSKDQGSAIDRVMFIEKSFGPVGILPMASQLVQSLDRPGSIYRSYPWKHKEASLSAGRPKEGENICVFYDVICGGSALRSIAKHVREQYRASVVAAFVYFDFEDPDCIVPDETKVLHSVLKRTKIEPRLAEAYEEKYGTALDFASPRFDISEVFAREVEDACIPRSTPEESAVVDLIERFRSAASRRLKREHVTVAGSRLSVNQLLNALGRHSANRRFLSYVVRDSVGSKAEPSSEPSTTFGYECVDSKCAAASLIASISKNRELILYEDKYLVAYLNQNPMVPGQTVILLKEHASTIESVESATAKHLARVIACTSKVLETALAATRVSAVSVPYDHIRYELVPERATQVRGFIRYVTPVPGATPLSVDRSLLSSELEKLLQA